MPYSQATTVTNLRTHTITIPTTDVYSFQGTLELPNIVPAMASYGAGGGAGTGVGGGPQVNSQVVVTISHNGSPIYTTNPGDRGFLINGLACTVGDTVTFVRSSSLLQDEQPQAVKMTLMSYEGVV